MKQLLCGCTELQSCPAHVFPLEHAPLRSCSEVAAGLCVCGDECDPGQSSCPACIRERGRRPTFEWAAQYRDDSGGLF